MSQVIWSLRTLTAILADIQARVVRHIDALLSDVRRLPMRVDLGPSDERIPPVRICDEAYLQMRRFLNVEKTTADYVASSRVFLNLPQDDKDAQIHKPGNRPPGHAWARASNRSAAGSLW